MGGVAMEKVIILTVVCVAIILFIFQIKKMLKGKNLCSGCGNSKECCNRNQC